MSYKVGGHDERAGLPDKTLFLRIPSILSVLP